MSRYTTGGRRRFAPLVLALLALTAIARSAAAIDDREFECLITPHQLVEVGSPVIGVLDAVDVERGDSVRAGQVLARLRSGAERAAVELARTRAEFEERRVARNEDLDHDELISEHDRDEMVTQALVSRLELTEATERLEMRTIRSPLNGVIVERFHSPGELVRETPILTLAQIDPLNIEVVLPVEHFGAVTVGSIAEVTPQAPVGGVHRATAVIVDRVIDAATSTFGVRLELPNPGGALPAGLQCRLRFLAAETGDD